MSASEQIGDYAHEHRPLGGYATLTSVFGTAFVGSLVAAHRAGRPLPPAVRPWDVVTVGVATHKITRLIAKDRVTSWVRSPFVRYQEPAGHGEVSEQPRGSGLRLAVGELLVCPYCLGQWVAAGLGVGLVASPRLTRLDRSHLHGRDDQRLPAARLPGGRGASIALALGWPQATRSLPV